MLVVNTKEIFLLNLHQNRVHFPAVRNAFVLDHQHGRRDVTCKPAIKHHSCVILYCTALHCYALRRIELHCIALHCIHPISLLGWCLVPVPNVFCNLSLNVLKQHIEPFSREIA